jgi:LEA14-like dessication related protein
MKSPLRFAVLIVLAALYGPSARGAEPAPDGAVTVLELTAATRERVAVWLRTVLARVAPGDSQTFIGEVAVAGVPVPVEQPVRVAVQRRADGTSDAVFFLDLVLRNTPSLLVARVGGRSVEFSVRGNLQSGNVSVPVWAVGTLKVGTGDFRIPKTAVLPFARFGGARFKGVSFSETEGEATALLYNPFTFPLDIKDISYTILSGERTLCTGSRHGLRIHPGRENEVSLPVVAKNAGLVAAAGSAVGSGGRIEGRLMASVTLKLGGEDTTLPVDLPGAIEVMK